MNPQNNIPIDAETVRATSSHCPPGVFLMGTSLKYLGEEILKINREKHLSLGSILASTPPHWVYLDGFTIGKRMVTNGDYSLFMKWADANPASETGYTRYYDNAELWRYVWNLHRIKSIKMPYGESSEGIKTRQENYDHIENFIEAYVLSISYEIERLLVLGSGPGSESAVDNKAAIDKVFKYIHKRLWESAEEANSFMASDGFGFMEEDAVNPREIASLIDRISRDLTMVYRLSVDKRFEQMLMKGAYPVETILFLQRFKMQILKLKPDQPVSFHSVLYPRFWRSPTGAKAKGFFPGDEVPWGELPVVGISLFEAIAYTTWLSQHSGVKVTLPNEAQFERAASWSDLPEPEGDRVELDPRKKNIFPWESQSDHEFQDFNYYFGQQGQDMDNYFKKHQCEYSELMQNTAKVGREGNDIYMLLGWGWQWTVDRFDEEETQYKRFDDNFPKYKKRVYRDIVGNRNAVVFKYRPNADIDSSYFVVRGAPDIIGGPGTTTRRFALNPLRGYRNVGFRFLVNDKKS